MPIETSLGQLTPFRRRGHLFFFSLAKPACRQTGRQAAKKSNRSLTVCRRPLRLCVFASAAADFFLSLLVYPPRRTGRSLKPTITVKNTLFKNFSLRTIAFPKKLDLPLTHHQEPVFSGTNRV